MTDKKDIHLVLEALRQTACGEASPSFRTGQFAALVSASTSIAASGTPEVYELIGRSAVDLLLTRLSSTMHAERTLALMRDNQKPLC